MDQSESRIFTFYSDDASKTEWAPEDEFSGGYGRLRAVTGGYERLRAIQVSMG